MHPFLIPAVLVYKFIGRETHPAHKVQDARILCNRLQDSIRIRVKLKRQDDLTKRLFGGYQQQ